MDKLVELKLIFTLHQDKISESARFKLYQTEKKSKLFQSIYGLTSSSN